jgi:hypothetical protein
VGSCLVPRSRIQHFRLAGLDVPPDEKVQRQLNATREEKDIAPHYRDKLEDFVKREGNLTVTKSLAANEDLIAADKRVRAMPDIIKTLEGRRLALPRITFHMHDAFMDQSNLMR